MKELSEILPRLLSPVPVAILVCSFACLVGILARTFKDRRTFAGYKAMAADVKKIARSIGAEIFRNGDDLVLSGNFERIPVTLRFSNSATEPGLKIVCTAPVDFQLSFTPKGEASLEGRVIVPTQSPNFNMRFTARTDDPEHAKLFLALAEAQHHIERLCCSRNTFLLFSPRNIELREVLVPLDTYRHVWSRLRSLAGLNSQAAKLPNASRIKVVPVKPLSSSWVLKFALLVGAGAAVAAVLSNAAAPPQVATTQTKASNGILPIDQRVIPDAGNWRTVSPSELRPQFIDWMEGFGVTPASKIDLDAREGGQAMGTAYLLATERTPELKRVVWVANHQVLFDVVDRIEGIAKVPRDSMPGIVWCEGSTPAEAAEGDGLLVVRDYEKPEGGTVFFFSHEKLYSAVPADFHNVPMKPSL
jgi:hypothetical protein